MLRHSTLRGALVACSLALLGCPASPSLQSLSLHLSPPSTFLAIPWGAGPENLGHDLQEEAQSDGPMSLTTDSQGRLWVLDQVNERVQVISPDGAFLRSIPIRTSTAQDLAVAPDGSLWILDRFGQKLVRFDPDGQPAAVLDYLGNGIAEPAVTTGLFVFDGSVGVQVEQDLVVRVASLAGVPDADRMAFDGVPSRASKRWHKAILKDGQIQVWDAAQSGALSRRRDVAFDLPARVLRGQWTDLAGRLYVAAYLADESGDRPIEREEMVVLSQEGAVLARAAFEPTLRPEEQFRRFAVSPEGVVYYLRCLEQGAVIERWSR